jgi:S-adenosylmethionine-diacylglycerol 3-amino-3-carboxypropyl transferase
MDSFHSRRSAHSFLETLNYSSVNEDWRTEAAALHLDRASSVLCVTGSGDRPLDLLVLDPARVTAIDLIPAQTHLLHLKIAALDRLDYEEYGAFLGIFKATESWRDDVWHRLATYIPGEAREYFDRRPELIRTGIIYGGRWERYFRRVSTIARFLRGRLIRDLFSFTEIDEQRRFILEQWGTPVWRLAYSAVCSTLTSHVFLRDPAFYAHAAVRPGPMIYDRMVAVLNRYLARENFMVSLLFQGRLPGLDLPPYLTPEGHRIIRARLDRLEIVTADLLAFLTAERRGQFTHYSLSDVPSYLTAGAFNRLLEGVLRASPPGGRLVIRQFLTRYEPEERISERFIRHLDLETDLAAIDRSFVYDFLIGEVA